MARIAHRGDATPFLPERNTLQSLREAAATQTVFGEGLKRSKVTIVGEMPGDREDRAGHPFELDLIKPEVLVLLGATAGKALIGGFKLTEARGKPVESDLAPLVTATAHPSAILRAPDDESRWAAGEEFTNDLRTVAEFCLGLGRQPLT